MTGKEVDRASIELAAGFRAGDDDAPARREELSGAR
jgi:hypothetical protein